MFRIVELQPPIDFDSFIKEVDSEFFHPGLPVTWIKDEYYGIYHNDQLIALGFLRGWDARWTTKWNDTCLGVAVLPEFRQQKLAKALCIYAEIIAQSRKLKRIRLHVHPDNIAALKLYEKLGYEITGTRKNGEFIMYKELELYED